MVPNTQTRCVHVRRHSHGWEDSSKVFHFWEEVKTIGLILLEAIIRIFRHLQLVSRHSTIGINYASQKRFSPQRGVGIFVDRRIKKGKIAGTQEWQMQLSP